MSFFFIIISYHLGHDVTGDIITPFKKIIKNPLLSILLFVLSYIHLKIGNYLFLSDRIIIIIINIIHCFIQGLCISLIILLIIDIINEIIFFDKHFFKCPLCKGKKFIDEKKFNKMERCKYCFNTCGYKNPVFFMPRFFCEKCEGK